MDFYETVNTRHSVRGYRNDPVAPEIINRIGEAVRMAPSACNRQPWKFLIVGNRALREKICEVYTAPWLKEAPFIIVALGDSENCWKRFDGEPIVNVDVAIAMEHLVLAAAAEGLGTCWVCAFEVEKMNRVLGITSPWNVVAISQLGYATDAEEAAPRRPHKNTEEVFQVIL